MYILSQRKSQLFASFYPHFPYLRNFCRRSRGIEASSAAHTPRMEKEIKANHLAPKDYEESERYYKNLTEIERNAKPNGIFETR